MPSRPAAGVRGERGASPRVSCIMPTRDRSTFAHLAVGDFLDQSYPDKELIVLDNGETPVTLPSHPSIRYVRHARHDPIGTLRNVACELASGEYIAHWDDDDWYAPWRLDYQVGDCRGDAGDIAGLSHLLFWDPLAGNAWQYRYPADRQPWVHGGTMLYRRDYWRRHPFPEIDVGEDVRFVWSALDARIVAHADDRFYVGIVHAGNTSPKQTGTSYWHPWSGDVRDVMGETAWRYRRAAVSRDRTAAPATPSPPE